MKLVLAAAAAAAAALVRRSCAQEPDGGVLVDWEEPGVWEAGRRFDGIGGISGGGATSRLLVDYEKEVRDEILDFLFLPGFGASLQMLKVEIGGDADSTDGSETSHMHAKDDLDVTRGYEWWMLKEAKKRNPKIKTYGLPWAFPAWVSPGNKPFDTPRTTANYTVQWMIGARDVHGVLVDYVGVWNERAPSAEYVKTLRKMLDANGFQDSQIVNNDGTVGYLCPQLQADPEYLAAVGVIGPHYPSDYGQDEVYRKCHALNRPLWSAEESSSYDDLNGAACWARVISSHYVLSGMTANLMWNLVGSYMHGTKWYASSMLTAVQPWSGYYEFEQMPVVWATAHYTQFTEVGWTMLPVGSGSGELPQGGFFVTFVSPDKERFATVVVKISRDHASCTRPHLPGYHTADEVATFDFSPLARKYGADPSAPALAVWYSNLEDGEPVLFERRDAAPPVLGASPSKVVLNVTLGSVFTITNQVNAGHKAEAKMRRAPNASFPLPYQDDFSGYDCIGCYARYLSDIEGAFEVQHDGERPVLRQMAPVHPLEWVMRKTGPYTVLGMLEWEDIKIETRFRLPAAGGDKNLGACVATRANQDWNRAITLCVSSESWLLAHGAGHFPVPEKGVIRSGSGGVPAGEWHTLSLSTELGRATAMLDGKVLCEDVDVGNGDNGFALLGATEYGLVDFASLSVAPVGRRWAAPPVQSGWEVGAPVTECPCLANGLSSDAQRFSFEPNWQIRHLASRLCVSAAGTGLALAPCRHQDPDQEFRNDYTTIRAGPKPLTNAKGVLCGGGGATFLRAPKDKTPHGAWCSWTVFPNTMQLRNQHSKPSNGGPARCLCATPTATEA